VEHVVAEVDDGDAVACGVHDVPDEVDAQSANRSLIKGLGDVYRLFAFQLDERRQLLPPSVARYLQRAAVQVLQLVDGVVLLGELGFEVLAAVVVDERHYGCVVVLQLGRGDDPAEGVALLAQISRQFAVEFLSGYCDVLLVEIDLQKYLVLFIKKVRVKGPKFFLCTDSCTQHRNGHNGKKSFHSS